MIKRLVKWYLTNVMNNLTFQIESLDMELGYNKNISDEEATIMKEAADSCYEKRHYIRYVINNILG